MVKGFLHPERLIGKLRLIEKKTFGLRSFKCTAVGTSSWNVLPSAEKHRSLNDMSPRFSPP